MAQSCGILILACLFSGSLSVDLETVYQWNVLDFNFPFDYGWINNFKPEKTVFTGMEVTENRIFLSMPRVYSGVPATLAFVPRTYPKGSSPVLQAYPDWSFHDIGKGGNTSNCEGIISVYRLRQDSCNRLWVLDSGVLTSLEDFRRICPPKILIFDLRTDQLVRRIVFPREVLRPASLLTNLVIDESVQGSCDSSFVYITDTAAPGIVVYDSTKDQAWRVMHASMFPDPDFSDSTVAGETFTLMDGIIGISHSPNLGLVYYQPLATNRMFSIPTEFLRRGPPNLLDPIPVSLVGTKSSQGVGLAVDPRDDTVYFSPVTETSVAAWNPLNNQQSLVSYDQDQLQFVAELKWAPKDFGNLWLISTRFQKFFRSTLNSREVNLRVIRIAPRSNVLQSFSGNSVATAFGNQGTSVANAYFRK